MMAPTSWPNNTSYAADMSVFLMGGGENEPALVANYAEFLAAAPAATPLVGCVIVDEGIGNDWFPRYDALLRQAGTCEPILIRVSPDAGFDIAQLADCDAVLVCGGLTPLYASAITPAAAAVRDWLGDGARPYCGFSAGAQIAADRALVGGWQLDGVTVCHQDCGEELDELSIVDGLALVPFAVEVHCAQWGTLSRVTAAIDAGRIGHAVAIDEDTMLSIRDGTGAVSGPGRVWVLTHTENRVAVSAITAGQPIQVPS
jgi:cyanophycinase